MRTLVEIDDACIRELDALAKEEKRSRAALIRDAIGEYLARRRKKHECGAFGLWGRRKMDALAYQAKMRREGEPNPSLRWDAGGRVEAARPIPGAADAPRRRSRKASKNGRSG